MNKQICKMSLRVRMLRAKTLKFVAYVIVAVRTVVVDHVTCGV